VHLSLLLLLLLRLLRLLLLRLLLLLLLLAIYIMHDERQLHVNAKFNVKFPFTNKCTLY